MTTIAYKDGVLAADSLICNENGVREGMAVKVQRLEDGSLVAWAGEVGLCQRFVERLAMGEDQANHPWPPHQLDKGRGGSVLQVMPDGSVVQYFKISEPDAGRLDIKADFYALGSGQDIAKGAMQAGASAVDAIKAAIKWDIWSGGPVVSISLKKASRAKIKG